LPAPSSKPSSALPWLAAIGVIVLGSAGAFAYAAGWLSPDRLTQDKLVGTLQKLADGNPGFRRNHAKGVCVMGRFESSGAAAALTTAAILAPGAKTPVIGRFALAGGMPFQADAPASVRSFALRFLPPGGAEWRTGMNDIPVFPMNSAQAFYDQLVASRPDPATGKPDPAKMQAFGAAHPETVKAIGLLKQRSITSGFGDDTYNGLNAFRFVDASGQATPVRWAVVPVEPAAAPAEADPAQPRDKDYLFEALAAQIHEHPRQWHLVVTIGEAGDATADATIPWPAERRKIEAGTVTIDQIASEATGPCTDVNYDPLVLPPGIEASDDPLLAARSAAYARSYTLRAGEKPEKKASAVTAAEIQGGAKP
jgi:catalase